MKEELITGVMQQILPYLDNAQLKQLRQVMEQTLFQLRSDRHRSKAGGK